LPDRSFIDFLRPEEEFDSGGVPNGLSNSRPLTSIPRRTTMKKTIGFIGLGIMGRPMAKNLLKAGASLVVHDIHREPVEDMVRSGALSASSSKEVAQRSEVIITMLPDSPEVKEVILGKEGVLEGLKAGSVVIDMSSINPLISREIAEELQKKGGRMLDAPVSGGEPGAIQGALAIMVGGEETVFNDCLEILKPMGKNIIHVGELGAGGFAKLVNQIIVAVNIAAVGEAFTLGVKAGMDPQKLYQAIRGGLAGSAVLDAKAPMIMARNFKPGFKITLHHKDLSNALSAGKDMGVPLPLTSLLQQVLISLLTDGKGDNDHSAIALFFEKLAKTEIAPQVNRLKAGGF
jgi:2-hydroxy-3-oxopropionate reductase